ncbi:hypothetical protein OG535_17610 [Kitasatospora sp. NBC_00085]|uniref:hypothetical protein n=1 Tax=unclassified Kitasatospora TaxID=2633591 RepID=UPI003248B642
MSPVPVTPRPLNAAERAVLEHVLSAGFDGAAELRSQLDRTEVVAVWGPRSVSVDVRVREPAPPAAALRGTRPLPVDAMVFDEAGEYVGELLVWTEDGALAGLEYAWVTDEMPLTLPPVTRIRPGAPDSRQF